MMANNSFISLPAVVGQISATAPLVSTGGTSPNISIPVANAVEDGYLSAVDWNTFNSKPSAISSNYITNPNAEIDTSGWNLYNNAGRTVPASLVDQDLTYTAVASGNAGNGINIDYIFHATQPSSTPLVTVVSSTHITVAWYNGPTLANNPTATQLKAAWDAVPGAVAIATVAISGVASNRQYEVGSMLLSGGGDTAPIDGTGGVVAGVTFTRSLINPLVGIASFDLGKDAANRQGSGVSTDFAINTIDRGNYLQVSFAYSASSGMVLGSNSDVTVWMYDITNAVMIPITPLRTIAGPVSTAITFVGKFLTNSSSANYRLILHISTTSAVAWDLQLDNFIVTDVLNPAATTQVPSVVLPSQPISGSVTDHMAVAWIDGASQWVPATSIWNGDFWGLFGFATNIVGSVADIYIRGQMSGFSFGPFAGYNQYVDPSLPGGLTPLPSPFTDTYLIMGKAINATTIDIQPFLGVDLVPNKGDLLTNNGANDGTGDKVLAVGANGTVPVANSAASLGIQWAASIIATAPFTFVTATRTLTIAVATNSVPGVLSAADHTTYSGYAATIALKAPLASPTFTGTVTAPAFSGPLTGNVTGNASGSAASFTGSLVGDVTGTQGATAISAATVTGKLITGFVSGAGVVAATDTILQAFNKIVGNIAAKAPLASPVFTGDVNASTGNVLISTIGKGLSVKTGTNAKIGTAVLVAGTVTVANTAVTANSRIFLTSNTDGGTPGWLRVSAKTAATSFVITSSSATDTSTVAWMIVESIP